ncbi:hypothetical protein NEPAR06_1870 [Nematocida parisii]|nr:hypothetical protein NEPAR07_2084 [Nematocida parisii]KAI5155484.1 hypothetical protein NEPAR06_1870 [Nematocida parisii]
MELDYSLSNLARAIEAVKKSASQQEQEKLLPYIETEDRVNLVFQRLQEEDSLGRFYCLILLQKSLSKNRTEPELDAFLDRVQYLIESINFTSPLEISKISSLYSTTALFYWPVKMPHFIGTLHSLIMSRSNLCMPVLKNFLQLVSDSLEITEERRYELKKSIGKIENDLMQKICVYGSKVDTLELVLLMNRIDIINESIFVQIFKDVNSASEISQFLPFFIENINIHNNGNIFYTVLSYLCSANSMLSIDFISNNINILESTDNKNVLLVYKIVTDAVQHIDVFSAEEVDVIFKVFLKLIKNYFKDKNFKDFKDLSIIVPIDYNTYIMNIVNTASKFGPDVDESKSITDSMIGIIGLLSGEMREESTALFRKYYVTLPVNVLEVLIKSILYPTPTGNPYLDLKQCVSFKNYGEILRLSQEIEMKTAKECTAVKEGLEILFAEGLMSAEQGIELYKKCLATNNYYSIDLAVAIGVILNRDDLIINSVQDFKGKGIIAFISVVEKCSRIVFKLFEQFKIHLLAKPGDMINEIEAITKLLEIETSRVKGSSQYKVDAIDVFGREILEKIFLRVEAGPIVEIRKIVKLLSYLKDRVHEAFIQKLWARMKSELDKQISSDAYENNHAIQNIISITAAECKSAQEAQVLYEIVENDEYSARGVLSGVKGVLSEVQKNEYYGQVLSAMIGVLVNVYVSHSDENTRATVVGLIIEKEERIQAMEMMYQINLSEVYAAKEKRPVMKKVLRQIEGMNEKQGALLKKPKKIEVSEDRWSEISTPFM